MADIVPIFDKVCLGTVTFGGTDVWVDVGSFGPDTVSPIANGKQIWIGFLTCIAPDKAATFELRPNLPTKSLGNSTDTQLRGFVSVEQGGSQDMDFYYGGAITTLAPVSAQSTGVEKLWLRIKSATGSTATYEFFLYYSDY